MLKLSRGVQWLLLPLEALHPLQGNRDRARELSSKQRGFVLVFVRKRKKPK